MRHLQKHATERRFSPSCALAKMGLTDEAYHLIKNSQRSPASLAPTKSRRFREDTEVIDFFAPPRADFLLDGKPSYMSEG